jgi:hypothetical protein
MDAVRRSIGLVVRVEQKQCQSSTAPPGLCKLVCTDAELNNEPAAATSISLFLAPGTPLHEANHLVFD